LDWEVEKVPIVTADGTPIKRRVAIVRKDLPHSDPNRVLGIVYPGFKPLQNKEAVALFDCLVGKGEPVYHTGGYLGNGEVIWLLAELPDQFRILVRDDDEVRLFMLFTNSHDGTIAVDIRITAVRVVCWNTLKMALSDRSRFVYKRWHRGDYGSIPQEIEALLERERQRFKSNLGGWHEGFSLRMNFAESWKDFCPTQNRHRSRMNGAAGNMRGGWNG
jgi:hypothetical protein